MYIRTVSFLISFLVPYYIVLQLHIDSHDPTSPTTKEEIDFFKEHAESDAPQALSDSQRLGGSAPQPIRNGNLKKEEEFGKN